jgi:hypothetical protein
MYNVSLHHFSSIQTTMSADCPAASFRNSHIRPIAFNFSVSSNSQPDNLLYTVRSTPESPVFRNWYPQFFRK